ncbi:hypothetical protein ACOMHN_056317 [Nucella lapillus]
MFGEAELACACAWPGFCQNREVQNQPGCLGKRSWLVLVPGRGFARIQKSRTSQDVWGSGAGLCLCLAGVLPESRSPEPARMFGEAELACACAWPGF